MWATDEPRARQLWHDARVPAMVLSAGLGTRLRPLSTWLPKALVPVGDRSVLAHVLDRLPPSIGPIAVNAHHRAADLRAFLGARASSPGAKGSPVHLVEEPSLLGTAGGVANARAALGEGDVLVWNGDIVAPIDVPALLAAHRAGGASATLVVKLGPAHTGNVGVDASGRVVRLRKESVGEEARGGEFAAVHVLGASFRPTLPAEGCLVGDVYLPALREGATLGVFAIEKWSDIGDVKAYVDANVEWLAERGLPRWTGAGARVGGGVEVVRSVIGEGAEVTGEGTLEDCVVWPGARAVAPLRRAVVAVEGIARL